MCGCHQIVMNVDLINYPLDLNIGLLLNAREDFI